MVLTAGLEVSSCSTLWVHAMPLLHDSWHWLSCLSTAVCLRLTGVYILTSVINIRKSIVLRGDGQGQTILRFPKSMTDLYGNTVSATSS